MSNVESTAPSQKTVRWDVVIPPGRDNMGTDGLGTNGGAMPTQLRVINVGNDNSDSEVFYHVGNGERKLLKIPPGGSAEVRDNVWNFAWVKLENKSKNWITAATYSS